jgi:hypothetical protein
MSAVDLIAFASQTLETIAIKDFDLAAPVLNQSTRLERMRTHRQGSPSHPEHMR